MSYDPIEQLTIAELDTCSRLLKADVVTAVHSGTMNRWAALAIIATVLARRTDPTARLETYRSMTPAELSATLGYERGGASTDDYDAAGEDIAADPDPDPLVLDPAAAPAVPPLDEIRAKAIADPTAPTRA